VQIAVKYVTSYVYEPPAQGVIQALRLTPRSHEGQFVRRWRIVPDRPALLRPREDAYGNVVHTMALTGPVEHFELALEGMVETHDTAGIVRGAVERFPPELYLRETPLTKPNAEIVDFAAALRRGEVLDSLHGLMAAVRERIALEATLTGTTPTAAAAFAARRGTSQDLTHVFLCAARAAGIPARYISGLVLRSEGEAEQDASDAWAEAHVTGLGWVGFDCANDVCVTEGHIRVAVGLDGLGAAPVRSACYGSAAEVLKVAVRVAQHQSQS
jgi:transglutaminase-like putative cysteine protease